jgi:HEPN domain-containing protein
VQPDRLHVVRQWVDKAEDDLIAAEQLLKLGADDPLDAICFHAQQCVEKYIKAVLTSHAIDVPRIHDIADLVGRMPQPQALGLEIAEQRRLTDYATVTRYPGDYDPITLEEAERAVAMAHGVCQRLRELLPNQCLSN